MRLTFIAEIWWKSKNCRVILLQYLHARLAHIYLSSIYILFGKHFWRVLSYRFVDQLAENYLLLRLGNGMIQHAIFDGWANVVKWSNLTTCHVGNQCLWAGKRGCKNNCRLGPRSFVSIFWRFDFLLWPLRLLARPDIFVENIPLSAFPSTSRAPELLVPGWREPGLCSIFKLPNGLH